MSQEQLPAIILAAGRGQRMRPLTDTTPKPMLTVHGKPLIEYCMEALVRSGCTDLTINTAHLGQQIESYFDEPRIGSISEACGSRKKISLKFSSEGRDFGHALETAGGIARALPLIGAPEQQTQQHCFWAVAADIFSPTFDFDSAKVRSFIESDLLALLFLVPNPSQHPRGDFGISPDGLALDGPGTDRVRHTFSAMGLYRRQLFSPPWCQCPVGNPSGMIDPLAPVLLRAIAANLVAAQLYEGPWTDVGTVERLAALNAHK